MMEAAEGGGASDWIMLSFASPKKGWWKLLRSVLRKPERVWWFGHPRQEWYRGVDLSRRQWGRWDEPV